MEDRAGGDGATKGEANDGDDEGEANDGDDEDHEDGDYCDQDIICSTNFLCKLKKGTANRLKKICASFN